MLTDHEYDLQKYWGVIYQSEYPFEYPQEKLPELTPNVDINDKDLEKLQYQCPLRRLKQLHIEYSQDMLLETMYRFCEADGAEDEIFYTHGDHLGSANWITDYKGYPIQYLHYMPYGQLLANQTLYGYDERYKFTGKERDAETGYDFFGARYYWSLLKHWTKVDPLVDNYLWISPYAYCNWNPVKYVDPNGKWIETAWDVANIGMDVASFKTNVSEGNVGGAIVDGFGLLLDAGATIVPGLPGGAGTAIKAYRTADKVSDAGKLGKAIDKVITATKSTYRQALQKATGKLGKGFEAHHTLPQKYRDKFEKLGINIDEPGNVVWRKSEGHRAKSAEHTDAWDKFFKKNHHPTKEQVLQQRDIIEKKVWSDAPKGETPVN